MKMSTTEQGKSLILAVDDPRIDAAVAVRFKDRVREMTQHPSNRVILDLSKVEFVDSSGLGAIVGAMKQMRRGRRLDLAGLTPSVDKVFRMTRMDSVFRIFDSVDAALEDVAHAS